MPTQRRNGSTEEKDMKFLSPIDEHTYTRVMGVDPSSHGIACTVVEKGFPFATVKIDFGAGSVFDRILRARKYFPKVLEVYEPEFVVIEQTILVQNPETTRKLSYVVGVLVAECLVREILVEDVPPATWKSFMGIKPLTKKWKESILAELGPTAGRKEIERLKKSQLQDKLKEKFPKFEWGDNDVADSTGIGLWAYEKRGIRISD
jgi:hypothetical protein